jgi:hypothetical protein
MKTINYKEVGSFIFAKSSNVIIVFLLIFWDKIEGADCENYLILGPTTKTLSLPSPRDSDATSPSS